MHETLEVFKKPPGFAEVLNACVSVRIRLLMPSFVEGKPGPPHLLAGTLIGQRRKETQWVKEQHNDRLGLTLPAHH